MKQRRLEDLGQKLYLKISRFIPDHFRYKPVSATQVAQDDGRGGAIANSKKISNL